MKKAIKSAQNSLRPPVVAVLGHVDHGKTTLLDTIRKTNITSAEHGGITQKIGAYQVALASKSGDKKTVPSNRRITFIDTPGHEAFSKMRARGSEAADIAVLVVAANDGVMPQTRESITHIKAAGIPMIVALNKIDLPEANETQVKQQLAKEGVLVEGYGGDVVLVPLSAKTGKGVAQLLEMILLVAELKGLTEDSNGPLIGSVIESRHDKHKGALATVIIKSGTLKVGDAVYADTVEGKIRSLTDENGRPLPEAGPSTPVEVMGWKALPQVGANLTREKTVFSGTPISRPAPREFVLPPIETTKKLKVILKVDALGSLEAILGSFTKDVEIIAKETGDVTESDVLLAKSTGAFVIGFNVAVPTRVAKLAQLEKVRIKTYAIIYELLDEIAEVVELLNRPEEQEVVLGEAEVIAEFRAEDDRVAGCRIKEGRVARGDLVKLMRGSLELGRTRVKSLRHAKEDISKAEKGAECGIVLEKKLDFHLQDRIISYKMHELLA